MKIQGLITADHIVEGHREKTLLLLWKMILHWVSGPSL